MRWTKGLRRMVDRMTWWFRQPRPALPTPEQVETLELAERVEKKLDYWARRRRALDLEASVYTRQEPEDRE